MMSICLFKTYRNNFIIRNFYMNYKTKIFIYQKLNIWKFGDYKHYSSLQLLTTILGISSPKDDIDGSEVAKVYYKDKNLERIVKYCEKDTIAVAQLLMRFNNEKPVEEHEIINV